MSTDETGRTGRRRTPLGREEIVAAALAIVDDSGLQALSVRRLADDLGSGAMSLYRHVRDKDELLDLVIDGILADVEVPAATGDWREDAAAIARAARAGMMRHRHAVALLGSRPWVGAAGLRGIDRMIGVFRRAGFSDGIAVRSQFALGNYVNGFCTWEAANLGAASDDPEARRALLGRLAAYVAGLPADEFPDLVAAAGVLVAGSLDDRFDSGLRFILDGIAATTPDSRA